jgi:hypothetical protein
MSGTVLEAPPTQATPEPPPLADPALLEDRVPPHLKVSRRTAVAVLLFGLIYAWFVLRPLWHTDLWGHLAYGRALATTGRLPATEPLMTLSQGMPFVDTAWLSQLIGYATMTTLGVAGLQGLTALVITAMAILLQHRLQARTRSAVWGWVGLAGFLALAWAHLGVVRPQLAGLLCFVVLWHRVTSRRPSPHDLWGLPLLHLLWANLHGSFLIGLTVLGVMTLGRAIDVVRRTGTPRSLTHDAAVRRWLVITQLSAVATLVNPYGLGLHLEVFRVAENPNLLALTEWQALNLRSTPGEWFLASAALLILLARWTPRRIAAWEPLLLIGLGCGTLFSARFAIWWAPVAAYSLTLHTHATFRRWSPWRAELATSPTTGKWSVVAVGLVWIFFAYSPLGMRVIHKKEPNLEKALSASTPLGVTGWLREHPPKGLVFNPYEWGDYLQWAGPDGMRVFLNSHAHLVPREVWLHYLQVMEQSAEWPEILDRYGINTVILDKEYRESLIRRFKDDAGWSLGYEDARGVVFVRRKPV